MGEQHACLLCSGKPRRRRNPRRGQAQPPPRPTPTLPAHMQVQHRPAQVRPTETRTPWVAWFSISCQAESNCLLSSSSSRCSAREMVSLAARSTSVALWKSCVAR